MCAIKKMAILFGALAASGFSTMTIAAAALPTGWYIEGNVGTTRESSTLYGPGISMTNNGLGWNVNLGYKFIPFFAAEIGYTNYANGSGKYKGVKVVKDSHYSVDLAGKAILPMFDTGFDFFAKLGLSRLQGDVSQQNGGNGTTVNTGTHTDTSWYAGLGAEYSFVPNMAVNLQWQRANGKNATGTMDLYSAGLSYMFG